MIPASSPRSRSRAGRSAPAILRKGASLLASPWVAAAALLVLPATGHALPSFARQMDLQCTACHTEFPIVNQFGRDFKLSGYTSSADNTDLPPLAVMLQPSFTNTARGQAGGAAPGFNANNNYAMTQASIFYAGRLFGPYADKLLGKDNFLDKFGIFNQTTYDGVGKAWSWDQTELRFANTGSIGDDDLTYGVYANNNPTMQDPWNSTPAWGFPFSGSGLAPGPSAATLIDGGLAGEVAGVGAYAFYNDTWYVDVGAYHTFSAHLQKQLGVDPSGEAQVSGYAPYWRIAMQKMVGQGYWEVGAYGLMADTYPGRDASAGQDSTMDVAVDTEYQISSGKNDFSALATLIHERQDWNASSALGNTQNARDTLWNLKATGDYLYDKTYGAAVQYFQVNGTHDTGLYTDNSDGSPFSDGFIVQLNYMPFNKNGGPSFWPRSNVKFSAQYTMYNRFDGARRNFDGNGTNASDNNTLYLEAWIVF